MTNPTPALAAVLALLPCPFCGGKAKLLDHRKYKDMDEILVECQECGATTEPSTGPYSDPDTAAARWNRRAPGGAMND